MTIDKTAGVGGYVVLVFQKYFLPEPFNKIKLHFLPKSACEFDVKLIEFFIIHEINVGSNRLVAKITTESYCNVQTVCFISINH